MPEYQTMYLALLNGLEDAIHRLKRAQQEGEELYLEEGLKLAGLQPPTQENTKVAD